MKSDKGQIRNSPYWIITKKFNMTTLFNMMMFVSLMGCHVWAAPSVQDNKIESQNESVIMASNGGQNLAARFLSSCFESSDMATCLAVKSITALNRAARSNKIMIMEGIKFTRDASKSLTSRLGRAMNENDIYMQLPENKSERFERLITMAMEAATDFFSSHNLEIKLPQETTQKMARALEEGRGKIKKMMHPIMMAIGAKMLAIIPLMLGGLALLVGKALVTAKVALVASLIVAAIRLFGGGGLSSKIHTTSIGSGGFGYTNSIGWSAPTNPGWSGQAANSYPYARNLNDDQISAENDEMYAQQTAYSGQFTTIQE